MGRKSRGKKVKREEREAIQQLQQQQQHRPGAAPFPPATAHEGHKFSDVLASFIYPVLDPQDDIDDVRAKMTWGVMIWNKAMADTFPDHPISAQIAEQFPLFQLMVPDEDLLTAFLERKKREFAHENFFIMEHKTLPGHTRGDFSISVSVLPVL
ncbi:hypothetical protein V9K67_16900 [Paraflavisolibacter sp. H34]|uniref:hypothetical protein n=1 Tax=Huijunlia imazamoxiresistens TaxID=3127457 RepID=UPI0030179F89